MSKMCLSLSTKELTVENAEVFKLKVQRNEWKFYGFKTRKLCTKSSDSTSASFGF